MLGVTDACHPERIPQTREKSKDTAKLPNRFTPGFLQPSHEATAWQATSLGMTVLALSVASFSLIVFLDVDREILCLVRHVGRCVVRAIPDGR